MNITDNLIRIKEGKDNIIQSLKNKGVSIADNTLINEIPTIIDNAEIGGGGDTPSVPTELVQKYEGASVFRINVPTDNYEFAINLCNSTTATYDVDWGDGSLEYGKTTDEQHHTYSKSGTYDVNVYNISKDITLGGSYTINGSSINVYYLFNNSNNDYWGGKYIYQKDDSTVTNVLIGDKITIIGSYAFEKCSSLQSVVISEGVTTIGIDAFEKCSSLQSINIPEGIINIENYCFADCYSLESVVIPDSVTTIGNYLFQNCSSLQSVVLPEGVITIGNNFFQNCFSLQSVVIPDSVTTIYPSSFQYCYSLQSIVIPKGVTKINNTTFSYCSSLQSVVIPNSVTSIGNYAFQGDTCLQSITCESLTAPTITSSSFPTSGFRYSKRYLYVPKDSVGYNDGNWKTYLIDKGWELRYIENKPEKVPTTLKLKTKNNFLHKLQAIGQANLVDYELVDNEYIYHFDDKIIELVQYTFYEKVLEEIELPEGLEIIGDYGFAQCYSLLSVVIPNSVTSIGNNAFNNCSSLQSIVIPNSVTSIGIDAFNNCSSLQSIVIPNSVTSIESYVFAFCSSLQSIVIPNSVTSIASYTFSNCTSLQLITCEAMTAPTITSNTFYLISSQVPSGTQKILRIPKDSVGYEETTSEWYKQLISKGWTVEYIVPNTLNYTSYSGDTVTPYAKSFEGKNEIVSNVYENGIGTLTFKEGLSEIYDSMYNKDVVDEITTIEIPNGVTKIGDYSFRSQNLITLNVPDSVTYIGDSAFNGCTKLTEITLGSGVETIGQWAFSSCTKVSTITSMAIVAPTFNQSFLNVGGDVSGDKILRVPEGAEGYDTWLSQLGDFTIEYI